MYLSLRNLLCGYTLYILYIAVFDMYLSLRNILCGQEVPTEPTTIVFHPGSHGGSIQICRQLKSSQDLLSHIHGKKS